MQPILEYLEHFFDNVANTFTIELIMTLDSFAEGKSVDIMGCLAVHETTIVSPWLLECFKTKRGPVYSLESAIGRKVREYLVFIASRSPSESQMDWPKWFRKCN
jgi:hypothetical protein